MIVFWFSTPCLDFVTVMGFMTLRWCMDINSSQVPKTALLLRILNSLFQTTTAILFDHLRSHPTSYPLTRINPDINARSCLWWIPQYRVLCYFEATWWVSSRTSVPRMTIIY